MLHKTRDLLVRQRTMLINALRGHLGEYGISTAQDAGGVQAALKALSVAEDELPELARTALGALARQLEVLGTEIARPQSCRKDHSSPEFRFHAITTVIDLDTGTMPMPDQNYIAKAATKAWGANPHLSGCCLG